eukprot:9181157-Lingulodinium_polyedra.AAC.1
MGIAGDLHEEWMEYNYSWYALFGDEKIMKKLREEYNEMDARGKQEIVKHCRQVRVFKASKKRITTVSERCKEKPVIDALVQVSAVKETGCTPSGAMERRLV